jgi:hypothetical protein
MNSNLGKFLRVCLSFFFTWKRGNNTADNKEQNKRKCRYNQGTYHTFTQCLPTSGNQRDMIVRWAISYIDCHETHIGCRLRNDIAIPLEYNKPLQKSNMISIIRLDRYE